MTNIKHDGLVEIATGRSRREMNWKNTEVHWSSLLDKLAVTQRTHETYAEYISSKKVRQDEIKDIGGFVGGFLTGGRRKNGSVLHRQLITLDLDFAKPGFWDDFCMVYDCAAAMYSTHKHTPDSPRLRLVIPLDRPVFADEYVAIARKVAGCLGIELFDHTTFEPVRLMYWPSTAKDAEFLFELQDGPWLNADAILASYRDWHDASEYPTSERMRESVVRAIKKQGDPLEKPGILGAFCRTHSLTEAIRLYLSDIYEPTAFPDRFTYAHGSTAGGLVVYEDKYAYSHHGTDPISGKLCNAFDLVRLHKFGLKDEDAREDTPVNKLPSYLAMRELAASDKEVAFLLTQERLEETRAEFADAVIASIDEPEDDSWQMDLEIDAKSGIPKPTIDNIVLILQNDPLLKNRMALDAFENREVAVRDLAWRAITPVSKYLTDADDANLRHYVERRYKISTAAKVKDAMDIVVRKNAFHPVKDYLEAQKWDGEPRVDRLLVDYLGAEDCEYTHAVTRKMLCAAVARIFRPGCKFDYVLVIVGDQGQGKSQLIDRLGRQWFSDTFSTIQGKEAFEQIQGVWLVEMGELAGLKKAETEAIKHFISKREDRYRVAYGRRLENFPRQCVFFGTSNDRNFLRDPTGNRRFWPVDTAVDIAVKDIFDDLTDAEVGQIWAEAVQLYRKGEKLYLPRHLEEIAAFRQEEHSETDERAGAVQRYLDTLLPENWQSLGVYERRGFLTGDDLTGEGVIVRERVCVSEIWTECLGGAHKDMTKYQVQELHNMMKKMPGWEAYKGKLQFGAYGRQRAYVRTRESLEKMIEKGGQNARTDAPF